VDLQVDWAALLGPPAVIEVVEVAAEALEEDGGGTEGQRAVLAERPAAGVEGAGLVGALERVNGS
jgi:hypothetical protein